MHYITKWIFFFLTVDAIDYNGLSFNKLLGPREIAKTIKYKEILNFGIKKITLLYITMYFVKIYYFF